MRKLYEVFSDEKLTPLVSKLSWSHYLLLLPIKDINKIIFYINLCINQTLSKRQLQEKIKNKEYEKFIERNLNMLNFDLEKIDVTKIQYVHMNNLCYSTKYRPNLCTFNLQTCVALYLYGKDFTFLAHINTTGKNVSDLFFDSYSKEFILPDFLLENILRRNDWNIYINDQQFYIGLVYGCNPYPEDHIIINSINNGINNMILKASEMGINIKRLEDKNLPEFILDFDSKEFITPSTKKYVK